MDRYLQLNDHFYVLDLYYGKTNLKPNHDFQCFFIVEHPCAKEFIREQALTLLNSQCRHFAFYGSYSDQWKLNFDLADTQVHPNEHCITAEVHSKIDTFAAALNLALSTRSFVPCDIYLVCDDDVLCTTVLEKTKYFVRRNNTQ